MVPKRFPDVSPRRVLLLEKKKIRRGNHLILSSKLKAESVQQSVEQPSNCSTLFPLVSQNTFANTECLVVITEMLLNTTATMMMQVQINTGGHFVSCGCCNRNADKSDDEETLHLSSSSDAAAAACPRRSSAQQGAAQGFYQAHIPLCRLPQLGEKNANFTI